MTILPSCTTYEGGSITLSCGVEGTLPISYQWYKNNGIIKNGTTNVVILNSLHRNASGYYKCLVLNRVGGKSTVQEYIDVYCKIVFLLFD